MYHNLKYTRISFVLSLISICSGFLLKYFKRIIALSMNILYLIKYRLLLSKNTIKLKQVISIPRGIEINLNKYLNIVLYNDLCIILVHCFKLKQTKFNYINKSLSKSHQFFI